MNNHNIALFNYFISLVCVYQTRLHSMCWGFVALFFAIAGMCFEYHQNKEGD